MRWTHIFSVANTGTHNDTSDEIHAENVLKIGSRQFVKDANWTEKIYTKTMKLLTCSWTNTVLMESKMIS